MNLLFAFKYMPMPLFRALALFVAKILNCLPNLTLKRVIDINLRIAYPFLTASKRKVLIKKIVKNQSLSTAESIKSWAMPPQWSTDQIHSVHNIEVLQKALACPNGMLAIVPHLGTWEMMNAWLNQFGSPTIMFKPIKQSLANEFVLKGRQRLNAQLVPTDASGVKAIFKTLKQGGFSIVLPDHVPKPSGGVNVPFFGVDTLTSTLAPKLANKTKCALVGLICIRHEKQDGDDFKFIKSAKESFDNSIQTNLLNKNGQFDIYCIPMNDPNLYHKDISIATTAFNTAIEIMINNFPSHYLWGYKRFKNMPVIKNPYKISNQDLNKFLATVRR